MRNWRLQLLFVLLMAGSCLGQLPRGLPVDPRPFGRYLVEVCTLSGDIRTISCSELPFPSVVPINPQNAAAQAKDQTITLKLVCDPAVKTPCDLTIPKIGSNFFVSATADSGLPVQQTVRLGNITPLGGSRTVQYRANGSGPIIIRATAAGTPLYTAAAPVDLILQVSADPAAAPESCPVLPLSPGTQSAPSRRPHHCLAAGKPDAFRSHCPGAQYHRDLFHARAT